VDKEQEWVEKTKIEKEREQKTKRNEEEKIIKLSEE
jgi:hypothetical protein